MSYLEKCTSCPEPFSMETANILVSEGLNLIVLVFQSIPKFFKIRNELDLERQTLSPQTFSDLEWSWISRALGCISYGFGKNMLYVKFLFCLVWIQDHAMYSGGWRLIKKTVLQELHCALSEKTARNFYQFVSWSLLYVEFPLLNAL